MDKILGVKVDNLSRKEILEKITSFLNDGKFHQIATINPEFILEAQKNEKYKDILNNCDLNIADGFGIKCAFWRYGKKLKARITGVDLMLEMLKMAEDRELSIFLACRKDGLSSYEETKKMILKKYLRLKINGEDFKCHSRENGNPVFKTNFSTLDSRFPASPAGGRGNDNRIFLCNFGSPYQEIFLNSLKNDIMGVAMGVGGSFDFLTGKIKRAPVFMRYIGLEWLWRLLQQPWEQKGKRFKRIWNAVVIFPIRIILNK